jgi:hypothetical protein
MNVDEHILRILATSSGRPVTIGDLARQLGISRYLVLPAARRLVDDGLASPSFVEVHGIPTLHGLMLLRPTTPGV